MHVRQEGLLFAYSTVLYNSLVTRIVRVLYTTVLGPFLASVMLSHVDGWR